MADEAIEPKVSLGGAVKEKIKESIQNMDLLNVLQKMVATTPEDEESEEVRDKLRGVLEKFNHMTDEEKESVTKQIKEGLANRMAMKLDGAQLNIDGLEDAVKSAIINQLIFVGVVALIIILLLVFFGYKLYKSIKDKEKKREEKKKAKQMKKKK